MPTKTDEKTLKRVRKLTEILEIPIQHAQKIFKTLPEDTKKLLDILEIPKKYFQTPQQIETLHQETIKNIEETIKTLSNNNSDPHTPPKHNKKPTKYPLKHSKNSKKPAKNISKATRTY